MILHIAATWAKLVIEKIMPISITMILKCSSGWLLNAKVALQHNVITNNDDLLVS